MASDLETTWVPRIGKEATEELRGYRKIGMFGLAVPVLAGGAGVLVEKGILVGGAVCAALAAAIIVAFVRAQRKLAATLSCWFGVKVKGLPKMNPKRFDAWCEERGLRRLDGADAPTADATTERSPEGSRSSTA
jgi:hypothetical protein